jgi:DNA primase
VRVPVLPGAEDPDSYARSHSPEELRALFDAADDLPGFLIRAAGKAVEDLSAEQKDGIVREATALLANHPSVDVRETHLQSLRHSLGLKETRRAAPAAPVRTGRPVVQDGLLGLFIPESKVVLKNEDKPEWQLLQLLLYHPEETAGAAAALNLDWFFDDRVREIVDYMQALLMEGATLELRVLVERVTDPLRDVLASIVELEKEEDSAKVLRKLNDYRDALELRYLKREKLGAKTLAQAVEIQKRIAALNSGKI